MNLYTACRSVDDGDLQATVQYFAAVAAAVSEADSARMTMTTMMTAAQCIMSTVTTEPRPRSARSPVRVDKSGAVGPARDVTHPAPGLNTDRRSPSRLCTSTVDL